MNTYLELAAMVPLGEHFIKNKIRSTMDVGEEKDLGKLPVKLRRYQNMGLAESKLQTRPEAAKHMASVGLAVIGILFACTLPMKGKKGLKTALALMFGGGLSNHLERCSRGYVTDYIMFKLPIPHLNKLVFNVADFCIFIGTAIICLRSLRRSS